MNVLNRTSKLLLNVADASAFPVSVWIHNPDLSQVQGLDVLYWKIEGDLVLPMDQAEQDAVNALATPMYAETAWGAMDADCTSYVESSYSLPQQQTIAMLLSEARAGGLARRATYCCQMLDWITSVVNYYHTILALIQAAETPAAVQAITWDFSQFDATNPGVTITGALAIEG